MSTINVNNLSGRGGATPNLPDGAVISGVATVTNLKPTNVNVSGAVTATTFDGSLKSTGTPTLGLGVTINSSGLHISGVTTVGVVTGGTFYGDGTNLTGVGETIAPWNYNPDVNDTAVLTDTGIGVSFNKKVVAGSGTATLKIVNAGVAGTTIQSWGINSFTQSAVTDITFGALVSDLSIRTTYQFDIPSGFIKDTNDTDYVGTAWTFTITDPVRKLFGWGSGNVGQIGENNRADRSSPTQIPGVLWADYNQADSGRQTHVLTRRTDGTLWSWGPNDFGALGLNTQGADVSSPTQIPGTNWASATSLYGGTGDFSIATKTDGTLWVWGSNVVGQLGLNQGQGDHTNSRSSPTQVGSSTDWRTTAGSIAGGLRCSQVLKTDGTLWILGGEDDRGELCQNNNANFSSPTQIYGSGTTWNYVGGGEVHGSAIKTDGTLWMWGYNYHGQLGLNDTTQRSSPTQVPGTTWSKVAGGEDGTAAIKTDGTGWIWGKNQYGQLGQNNTTTYSSPIQIPGTTWSDIKAFNNSYAGLKTDGTLWAWGQGESGELAQNNVTTYSSPVQIGSDVGWTSLAAGQNTVHAQQSDITP